MLLRLLPIPARPPNPLPDLERRRSVHARRQSMHVHSSSRPDGETSSSTSSASSRRAALLSAAAALAAAAVPRPAARAEDTAAVDGLPLPAEEEPLFSQQLGGDSPAAAPKAAVEAVTSPPQPPQAAATLQQQKSVLDGQGTTALLPASAASQLTAAQRQVRALPAAAL